MAADFQTFTTNAQTWGVSAREFQIGLVRMSRLAGLTNDQVEGIADRCIAAREAGAPNVAVLHHAAAYFGASECRCAACFPAGDRDWDPRFSEAA